MKILLDHDLPKKLRLKLPGHLVLTARQMGWDSLSNGRLLAMAGAHRFDVLLTADRKMFAQNSHLQYEVGLVVVTQSEMVYLEPMLHGILEAIARATPGSFEEIEIPIPPKRRNIGPGV